MLDDGYVSLDGGGHTFAEFFETCSQLRYWPRQSEGS